MDKLIYSKTHPKEDFGKELDELDISEFRDKPLPSSDEMTERMSSGLYLEEIPGRREKLPGFMEAAKQFCDEYEYDLRIYETAHGILLEVSMDSGQYTTGRLNRLIGMTDDIDVLTGINNRDVTFFLRYHVAAICRDGSRIFPEILGQ